MTKKIILIISLLVWAISGVAQTGNTNRKNKPLSARDTITDNAIVYPADMERNFDELLTKWSSVMKYDPNCNITSDVMVTYPDSTYINRLYSLPTRMELVFNPVVKNYIEMYAGRRRSLVSYMLGEGQYYFPMFEQALDKENLPLELKYLPVIESALNPIARSRVGATGLWQFMMGTGRMYNLEINSLVDERRDPQKSTDAAVKYLKDMYNIYGDWNLVIAAYNCGPGNVNKAIRRSGGQTDYWAIYPYLPKETRGYVPAFIAATYIMSYYDKHNICPAECTKPSALDTLRITNLVHFKQISEVLNIPIEDIRAYNPEFKQDIIPGNHKPYTLNLPINHVTAYIENADKIYTYKTDELLTHRKVAGLDVTAGIASSAKTYRVKRGDTLGEIASKFGVTVAQLKKWNGLRTNNISVGRRLKVQVMTAQQPQKEESPVVVELNERTTIETRPNYILRSVTNDQPVTVRHKVRRGESLASIANKYDVSLNQIKDWNNMKSNNLVAGRTLKIEKQETKTVTDTIYLSEPEQPVLIIDPQHLAELVDDYLDKISRDQSTLPLISISTSNSDEDDSERPSQTDATRIIYHKVKIGETLPQIAARYKVSRSEIKEWNKMKSNVARIGQRLLIRLPKSESEDQTSVNDNTSANKKDLTSTENTNKETTNITNR